LYRVVYIYGFTNDHNLSRTEMGTLTLLYCLLFMQQAANTGA